MQAFFFCVLLFVRECGAQAHIDGSQWNSVDDALTGNYHKLGCSDDATKCFAAGTESRNASVQMTIDGGITWENCSTPALLWTDITCSSDGTSAIAVSGDTESAMGRMFTTSDSGVTWTETIWPDDFALNQPRNVDPVSRDWTSVACDSTGSSCVVILHDPRQDAEAWYSHDGGATWNETTTDFARVGFRSVFCGAETCIALASTWRNSIGASEGAAQIGAWLTQDWGVTWEMGSQFAEDGEYYSNDKQFNAGDCAPDGLNCFVSSFQYGTCYNTTDGGVSWTKMETDGYSTQQFKAVDLSAWPVMRGIHWNSDKHPQVSLDAGITWDDLRVPISQCTHATQWNGELCARDLQDIACATDGENCVATNRGQTIWYGRIMPTEEPTTAGPTSTGETYSPTLTSEAPTDEPTDAPTVETGAPTTDEPTDEPTDAPTVETGAPTDVTTAPTEEPTAVTTAPTEEPTEEPTTAEPTSAEPTIEACVCKDTWNSDGSSDGECYNGEQLGCPSVIACDHMTDHCVVANPGCVGDCNNDNNELCYAWAYCEPAESTTADAGAEPTTADAGAEPTTADAENVEVAQLTVTFVEALDEDEKAGLEDLVCNEYSSVSGYVRDLFECEAIQQSGSTRRLLSFTYDVKIKARASAAGFIAGNVDETDLESFSTAVQQGAVDAGVPVPDSTSAVGTYVAPDFSAATVVLPTAIALSVSLFLV